MSNTVSPPWLVALKGLPGCGKSTVAATLSRSFGWPIVDKDDIQDAIDAHLAASDGPAYEIMFRVARSQLRQGLSVIVDSPLWKQTYDNARALAEEQHACLAVIECRCADERVWRQRIEARKGAGLPARRTTSWESLLAYRSRYELNPYEITVQHLVIETDTDRTDIVSLVRSRLGM